jgi:hypothetical protein
MRILFKNQVEEPSTSLFSLGLIYSLCLKHSVFKPSVQLIPILQAYERPINNDLSLGVYFVNRFQGTRIWNQVIDNLSSDQVVSCILT